jgi:aspartyl-tRNA(Asn)/glutamyl-tRNA(Gln) amidotransferase subunit C
VESAHGRSQARGTAAAVDEPVRASNLGLVPIDIDIAHVARLARIELSDQAMSAYRAQLGVILEHAARVQAVDTTGLEPTAHPLGMEARLRPDVVEAVLDRAEVLDQAPDHRDGYFVVPPAMGSE